MEQKIVFGRLGIMSGSFSLDAAQQVATGERAKCALGQVDYDAALAAGRALSYDEAFAEMTKWLQSVG